MPTDGNTNRPEVVTLGQDLSVQQDGMMSKNTLAVSEFSQRDSASPLPCNIPLNPLVPDVFISYSSTDRQFAEVLAASFERQQWVVWWDRQILAGQYFDQEIEKALDASKVVVLLWSESAARSHWVRGEADEAASRNVLIPVRLDATPLPLRMRRIQTADLRDWLPTASHSGFGSVLEAIAARLHKPVLQAGPMPSAEEYTDRGRQYETRGDTVRAAAEYIQALKTDRECTAAAERLMAIVGKSAEKLSAPQRSNIELGTVLWFNPRKGFGFIARDNADLPVFVHITAVERSGLTILAAGERVAYVVESDRGKSAASDIKVL